jgi:hypothetical protein
LTAGNWIPIYNDSVPRGNRYRTVMLRSIWILEGRNNESKGCKETLKSLIGNIKNYRHTRITAMDKEAQIKYKAM